MELHEVEIQIRDFQKQKIVTEDRLNEAKEEHDGTRRDRAGSKDKGNVSIFNFRIGSIFFFSRTFGNDKRHRERLCSIGYF
jgi:hypothetical protein